MTIVPHIYNNDNLIFQLDEDTYFGDYLVPQGYVNATQICKAGGKLLGHYLSSKQQRIQLYLNTLSNHIGIPIGSLIIKLNEVPDEYKGTWVHPRVAINIARWVSPEFEVWADGVIWYVLSDDYQPDDSHMVELKDIGLRHWKRLRKETKSLFQPMTDAFKDYWNEVGFSPESHHYASMVDLINELLFGLSAREIRQFEGILEGSQLTRDTFGEEALDRIAYMEKLVCGLIRTEGIAPELAIYKAYDIMNVDAIDYWC